MNFLLDVCDSVHVLCRMMAQAVGAIRILGIILEISCVAGKSRYYFTNTAFHLYTIYACNLTFKMVSTAEMYSISVFLFLRQCNVVLTCAMGTCNVF